MFELMPRTARTLPYGRTRRPVAWGPEVADLWDRFFGPAWTPGMALPAAEATGFIPCVDLRETDGHYEVTAELPGVKPEDVKVSVSGDVLTVEGEKRAEKEEETAEGHMVERSFGTFRRSFRLPIDPDPDKVSATQEAGVLKVQIPKRQESGGTKQIEVKSA